MRQENKELNKYLDNETVLTAREILLFLVDGLNTLVDISDGYHYYRKTVEDYKKWRDFDKEKFRQSIYRLKRQKFIKIYFDKKTKYIELNKSGQEKINNYFLKSLKISKPRKWDRKWRIIIFDIPEKKKLARDILTRKLENLGFLRIQKSVFIFPFSCKKEIDFLKNMYDISRYVQYIIVDRIEFESNILKHFCNNKILDNDHQ